MRFWLIGSVFAILSLCVTAVARAQPSAPAGKTPLASPLELLQWEASLAENGYNNQKSDKRLTNLIGVYERIIALACMPQLQKTLYYKGSPTDPTCLKYLDETFKIDPENPMALCARDGIDSKSCETAYDVQDVGSYSKDSDLFPGEDSPETQLELNLDSSREEGENASTVESELYRLENAPLNDPSERQARQSQILQIYNKLIRQSCGRAKLKLVILRGESGEPLPPEMIELLKDKSLREQVGSSPPAQRLSSLQQIAAAQAANSALAPQDPNSPMDQVVKVLNATKDPGTGRIIRVRQDGVLRWRLLTQTCQNSIKRARDRGQSASEIACAELGEFAPACIRGRRTERALAERIKAPESPQGTSGKKTSPPSPKNFSTF